MSSVEVNKVAVIGAGSWGTALAGVLSANGVNTVLWGHNEEHVIQLKDERENKKYLPGYVLPESLKIVTYLKEAATGADVV